MRRAEQPDILRELRRAVAYDEHARRLWALALDLGYSPQWVERRLSEIFRTGPKSLRPKPRSF